MKEVKKVRKCRVAAWHEKHVEVTLQCEGSQKTYTFEYDREKYSAFCRGVIPDPGWHGENDKSLFTSGYSVDCAPKQVAEGCWSMRTNTAIFPEDLLLCVAQDLGYDDPDKVRPLCATSVGYNAEKRLYLHTAALID